MSNIINKSNHPVEVKRINLSIWKLRDEIEQAIANRLDKEGQTNIDEVDIEDIRTFYSRSKPAYLDPDYDPDDEDEEDDDNVTPIGSDGVDSSGNEMDDDAKAMMEALQGADGEGNQNEDDAQENEDSSDGPSEEDDEAAKIAAEMLGDQATTSNDNNEDEQDDEAAKLAAQMLGDQGSDASDEPTATKEEKKQTSLKRIYPAEDKISKGFSVLSDINMENIVFFSQHKYTFGQNIAIEFLIPNSFLISAEVVSCLDMTRKSKIISNTKPNYRVEASLTYFWEGERTQLRNFLKSVEPEIPPPPKKIKRPDTEDDDDDEFEDLGF